MMYCLCKKTRAVTSFVRLSLQHFSKHSATEKLNERQFLKLNPRLSSDSTQIIHHQTSVSELTSAHARSSLSARTKSRASLGCMTLSDHLFRHVVCQSVYHYELASVNQLHTNGQDREENKDEV